MFYYSNIFFLFSIEVIDFGESITSTGTNPTTMDELALSVHPSNMDVRTYV